MDELAKLMDNENVEVAYPEVNRFNHYDKVDKKIVQNKLRTNEQLNKVQKDLEGSSFEQRLHWIMEVKATGDKLYYDGKFEDALKEYLRALMGLNYEGLTTEQHTKIDIEAKLKILMNMALCSYNMQQYGKAYKFLKQAESVHSEPKIYYIYSLAMFKELEYENALQMINKAITGAENKYSSEIIESYRNFKVKITKHLRNVVDREKQLYKNIIDANIYVL